MFGGQLFERAPITGTLSPEEMIVPDHDPGRTHLARWDGESRVAWDLPAWLREDDGRVYRRRLMQEFRGGSRDDTPPED